MKVHRDNLVERLEAIADNHAAYPIGNDARLDLREAAALLTETREALEQIKRVALANGGAPWDLVLSYADNALAAGTRSAETSETSAPSEGCQSGDAKQRNAQSNPPSGGSSHA